MQPPFWLVWEELGFAPNYKHPTREEAEKEAARLSALSPGKKIFVLKPSSVFLRAEVEVTRFRSSGAST